MRWQSRWCTFPSMQSWMLVVQMPVRNSSSSKVMACAGMKNSVQQYGSACRGGRRTSTKLRKIETL